MSFQFFPLYTGDYLRDTRHLSPCEHGIYLLLLMHCWDQKGPAPLDERKLQGICNVRSGDEVLAMRRVLDEFFTQMDDGHYNKRMAAEVQKADALSSRRSMAAEMRWSKKKGGMPADDGYEYARERHQRLAAARRIATHTGEEWNAMVRIHGGLCVKCGSAGAGMVKDHIKPLYQGGSDGIENLQPLCAPCNAKKGAEATDYRNAAWRDALAGILQGTCSSDEVVLEQTIHHTPITTTTKAEAPRSRGSRLPAECPDESDIEWCRQQRPDLDPLLTRDRFRDYWLAAPGSKGVKANWQATWRNWCRNEKPTAGAIRNGNQRTAKFNPYESIRRAEAALARGVDAPAPEADAEHLWPSLPVVIPGR